MKSLMFSNVPSNETTYTIVGLLPGNLYSVQILTSGAVDSDDVEKHFSTRESLFFQFCALFFVLAVACYNSLQLSLLQSSFPLNFSV